MAAMEIRSGVGKSGSPPASPMTVGSFFCISLALPISIMEADGRMASILRFMSLLLVHPPVFCKASILFSSHIIPPNASSCSWSLRKSWLVW